MRENFILSSDKNNGYPSFSDSVDLDNTDFYKNKNQFISDGVLYPKYKKKNTESEKFSHYSKNIFFLIPDINDGYPVMTFWYGLKQKVISDIYSGDSPARIIYYRGMPVKSVYFREKAVYKFGFGE